MHFDSLVLARGGSVLFRGGDTFIGNLQPNIDGNGDPTNPVVIGSYGTGKATLIAGAGGETGVINIEQMSGVVVQDLIIRGGDLSHMPRGGIRIGNNSATRRGGITIQRCDIGNICYYEATAPSPTQQGHRAFTSCLLAILVRVALRKSPSLTANCTASTARLHTTMLASADSATASTFSMSTSRIAKSTTSAVGRRG